MMGIMHLVNAGLMNVLNSVRYLNARNFIDFAPIM